MTETLCPVCAEQIVLPRGPKSAKVLVIGEKPGKEELEVFQPFVGWSGKWLRKELAKVGQDLGAFRITNLWVHDVTKDDGCFNYGVELAVAEAQGREIVLLLGSEAVKTFTGHGVMEVSGLEVESDLLSARGFACCSRDEPGAESEGN